MYSASTKAVGLIVISFIRISMVVLFNRLDKLTTQARISAHVCALLISAYVRHLPSKNGTEPTSGLHHTKSSIVVFAVGSI